MKYELFSSVLLYIDTQQYKGMILSLVVDIGTAYYVFLLKAED